MVNPLGTHSSATGTNPNMISRFTSSFCNRITSLFRNRLENAPSSAIIATTTPPIISISEAIVTVLHSWVEEDPEEVGRKKAYHIIVCFLTYKHRNFLNLAKLGLSSLPDIFNHKSFNKLQILRVYENNLSNLPSTIVSLKEMTFLEAYNNRLEILPEDISKLENLAILDLSTNHLACLPKLPSKLKQLNLSDNYLTEISKGLLSIKKLNLENNPNGYLNGSIPLVSPVYYKAIMIPHEESTQTIDNLEEGDGCKKDLKAWLNKAHEGENREKGYNHIVSFLISNKIYLNLRGLNLTSLPDIFNDPRFRRLKHLDLSNNQLENIPEAITNLENITTLGIINNKLKSLPLDLHKKLLVLSRK